MSEENSTRYWFALIISSIVSIFIALVIIILCKSYRYMIHRICDFILAWYLLWKFVLSRFGVIRALFQINKDDPQPTNQTKSKQPAYRRQPKRRE